MHDTCRSFELVFMKFTREWVDPIVFGNNRPNRTTDMGENVSPKPVSDGIGFFEEKV